jgi:anti-sigma B factor antagonist
MELIQTQLKNTPVLELKGELDHGNSPALGAAIDEVLDAGERIVLLEVSHVDYIDSGGVSVLLSALRRLRGTGWLGIIGPNANVRRLLDIVGLTLDDAFVVFAGPQEAENALKESLEA